jgi:NAD+-dependent protein deacetylase sirtuin 4
MKPTVVFFGENIDPSTAKRSFELAEQADCIVVAGSSLQVFSAFRLIKKAIERGTPYGIINIGPTRADDHAAFKFQDRLGELLPHVIEQL